MKQRPDLIDRAARQPLCVRVVTQPALAECWSVNISTSGAGLVAAAASTPAEGDALEIELSLPDSGSKVSAHGVVTWRHDEPPRADGRSLMSLGVRFVSLGGGDQLALTRYLSGHRFQVAVAFASALERAMVQDSLSGQAELHHADSPAELEDILKRGDIAAILISGDDGALATRLAERLGTHPLGSEALRPPVDLTPRVIFAADARPDELVRLFNAGVLFRSLARPLAAPEVQHAVLDACREHGVGTEQRRVALALERALWRERALQRPAAAQKRAAGRVIYQSAALHEVVEQLRLVAPHKMAVLLQGETGTGKEVLAHTLHELSDRQNAPFVLQDCGTLTETLLESELFGHVKGSFTGAVSDHPGLFVLADSGTVFLDEIENTTPKLQAQLLRVLETGEVRPVGGTVQKRVDVRVVAASNRDLAEEVRLGHFRSDLYYRLSTFPIAVPPLRARLDDVLPIARHFVSRIADGMRRTPPVLSAAVERALLTYAWPGNVRELRNVIERALLLCGGAAQLGLEHLPPAFHQTAAAVPSGSLKSRVAAAERELIRTVLAKHGGVLRRAAQELGADAVTLGRKARRYGLA